jgi:hypothetical protein
MTDKAAEITQQAPPLIEFDPDGNVVNSFGDWKVVPNTTHASMIDYGTTFGPPLMAMEPSKSTVTTENYSCRSAREALSILPMALSKAGR